MRAISTSVAWTESRRRSSTGDGRHVGFVAVVADADAHAAGEIDTLDPGQKPVHEMLTRLLAVGDDVDAGILLDFQREQRRVALALGERLAVEPPRGPQLARLGEPGRFRQTAGDRGFEHWFSQSLPFRLTLRYGEEPETK